ncbi:wd40 repeat-like protein [Malassezia pachydermatis]|uniref:Wd40 repeat-like protein n=1 Tax=Malassezia pachydermatis TaxID=77020 RepID=A0A0M8MM03_9BASI|nr:wd40 repeat-like protein [Malassezia pachydermatis]KOS12817.1 wd40 repeat-like protein [Malassezia pachydermatis]
MSDPFFQKKRKRSDAQAKGRAGRKSARDSDSEDGLGTGAVDDMDLRHDFDEPVNDTHHETPAEAKVRLAKLYLEGLREKEEDDVDGIDAAAVDRDNIAARLRKDVEETGGRMHIRVAARVAAPVDEDILAVRGHRACVTYARTSDGAGFLYTSDKDGRILQWRLRDGAQVGLVPRQRGYEAETDTMHSATSGAARRRARARLAERGHGAFLGVTELRPGEGHTSSVLALAVSDDGQYLATAGKDKRIGVWSVGPDGRLTWRKALLGHKDAVRSVAFRGGSAELFSASYDRTVKLFDAAQLSYIETLFGHQESIQDLSCLKAERAVTAGGRERTCRLWKIREESQLVFRGGTRSKVHALLEGGDLVDTPMKKNEVQEGSVDCVAMIDDHHFVSGSDNGNLSLWSVAKKKPLFSVQAAHGMDERYSETEGVQRTPRYITSVACLPYGDIFVSGSWDGVVRVWALDDGLRSFRWLCDVRAPGIVNSLQLVTPAIEHMDDYPVVPSQWRRRGGLDAPLMPSQTKGLTVDGTQSKRTTRRAGIQTTQEGRVLGHKESIAPLLIVGLGSEPRADRWIDVPQAQNGALVVPLWLS